MSSTTKAGYLATAVAAALAFAASPVPDRSAPTGTYRVKLKSFVQPPAQGPQGLLIPVRVNNGPLLSLLLDSGARFLVLDRKTAARSGCHGGSPLDLIGAGASAPKTAAHAKAALVDAGGVQLQNVDVAITEDRVLDGIDGVLPLSVFSGYLIRLDVKAKHLELTRSGIGTLAGGHEAIVSNGLLFLTGSLNDSRNGLFLLDTGAAYNAISTKLARAMNIPASLAEASIPVQGIAADMFAPVVRSSLHLRIGSNRLQVDPVITVDLSLAGRFHDLEVSGLLGYPGLRSSILTVDYTSGMVRIDRK